MIPAGKRQQEKDGVANTVSTWSGFLLLGGVALAVLSGLAPRDLLVVLPLHVPVRHADLQSLQHTHTALISQASTIGNKKHEQDYD